MNTKLQLKEKTGRIKLFKTDFNKKIIAAGPFYPLFRADYKWSLIITIVDVVIMYAAAQIPLTNWTPLKMLIGYLVPNIVFASIYSKNAIKEALLNGFVPNSEEDKKLLEDISVTVTEADIEAYNNKNELKKQKAEQKKADKAAKKAEKAQQKAEAKQAKAKEKAQKEAEKETTSKETIDDIEDIKEIKVDTEIDVPLEEVEKNEEINIEENETVNEAEKDLY